MKDNFIGLAKKPWGVAICLLVLLALLDMALPYSLYGQIAVIAFCLFVVFMRWPSRMVVRLVIGALVFMMLFTMIQSPVAQTFSLYAFLFLLCGVVQGIREFAHQVRHVQPQRREPSVAEAHQYFVSRRQRRRDD